MKRKWLAAGLIVGMLISGCMKGNEESIALERIASLESESEQLRKQLEQLQGELRVSEAQAATWKEKLEANQVPLSVADHFPKLTFLANSPAIKMIEIKDEQGSNFITDPSILASVSNAFAVQHLNQVGSPPQPDIETAELVLTTDQGTIHVRLIQRNMVQFGELYPWDYFAADVAVSQLAKAFMNRPLYISGEQSAVMKMIDSGLMRVDEDIYMTHPGRILSMAKIFSQLEKKSVGKPVDPSPLEMALTFYYYGEEVKLRFYRNHAQLIDGEQESWFELQDGVAEMMRSNINAG